MSWSSVTGIRSSRITSNQKNNVEKNARIYVAGHSGLVGSALVRALQDLGYRHLITRPHAELDLSDRHRVRRFFSQERPEFVFMAAAKVGGIVANERFPADFIRINLEIETNVIHETFANRAERLLFLGSTCVYPRDCEQPIREEYLLSGPLESTNSAYAIAKIAGIEMCRSYNAQHGTQFLCPMPTNLYGPGDLYDPENSHVLPALIRRFHEAREQACPEVVVWGSGTPRREFLYSDDLARACIVLMNLPEESFSSAIASWRYPIVNIGTGTDVTISELAALIADVVGYRGRLVFDTSRPDGTPRKVTDPSRVKALGWKPQVSLRDGIGRAFSDFKERVDATRPQALDVRQ